MKFYRLIPISGLRVIRAEVIGTSTENSDHGMGIVGGLASRFLAAGLRWLVVIRALLVGCIFLGVLFLLRVILFGVLWIG